MGILLQDIALSEQFCVWAQCQALQFVFEREVFPWLGKMEMETSPSKAQGRQGLGKAASAKTGAGGTSLRLFPNLPTTTRYEPGRSERCLAEGPMTSLKMCMKLSDEDCISPGFSYDARLHWARGGSES